jgi:hypothetical protein
MCQNQEDHPSPQSERTSGCWDTWTVRNQKSTAILMFFSKTSRSLTDFPEISQFHLSSQNVHEGFWGLILWSHSKLNRCAWFKSSLWLKWSNLNDPYFHFHFLIHAGKYILNAAITWCHPTQCDAFIFMNTSLTGRWISFNCSNGL